MAMRSTLMQAVMAVVVALVPYSVEAAKNPPCVSPAAGTAPGKIVNIQNNTDNPIWVVLETAKQDLLDDHKPPRPHDRWLQAEFQPTLGTYASTYLYRTYVNPTDGIPKQSSVSVTVPFYTQLEKKPCPDDADQYINWWRALRIYIYDDEGAIKNAYDKDTNTNNALPISTFAPDAGAIPTCVGCSADLVVYRDLSGADKHGVSLPFVDPSQLLEFTFATVDPAPKPLRIDHDFVDYDISSVDQVYLPVAMDPVDNPFIGFIGSVLGRKVFSDKLDKFQKDFKWPKYKWPSYVTNQNALRLPATFNVMNEIAHPGAPPPFDPAGDDIKKLKVIQDMENLWDDCCGAEWPGRDCKKPAKSPPTCDKMAQVAGLFDKNYDNYKKLCRKPVDLTRDEMMAKVYGWVPFHSCPGGDVINELKDTPNIGGDAGYHKIANAYVDLQYHSPPDPSTFGDFNRYVELIHDKKYLRVGEYAFSIDDAAGNMLELGRGVNITVGAALGLGNVNPYDPWRFFLFNVGAAKDKKDEPNWKKFRICQASDSPDCPSQPPDRVMKVSDRAKGLIEYAGIKIGAVECPCVIVLQDSNGALYKVLVKKLPQPPPTHPVNEEGDPPTANDDSWTKKDGHQYANVVCFDAETSFEWCGNLQPARIFDEAVQRSVYHVNTSAPVVLKAGIRFGPGKVEGTLSADRLSVTVMWPKAVTQPPGRQVTYELTLWDRENCPRGGAVCNGHAAIPVPGTCDSTKTECTVLLSSTVAPLTADTLKSMSVVAKDPDNNVAQKEANFTQKAARH
jgi:hypothetical protein